jgi:hypothetical protein
VGIEAIVTLGITMLVQGQHLCIQASTLSSPGSLPSQALPCQVDYFVPATSFGYTKLAIHFNTPLVLGVSYWAGT